jgi:hypothetical protein
MYFDRSGGGRLQGSYRHAPKTSWHAPDRTGLQRRHCTTLLQTERTVPGFLGTQIRTVSRVTPNFSDVHPSQLHSRGLPPHERWPATENSSVSRAHPWPAGFQPKSVTEPGYKVAADITALRLLQNGASRPGFLGGQVRTASVTYRTWLAENNAALPGKYREEPREC